MLHRNTRLFINAKPLSSSDPYSSGQFIKSHAAHWCGGRGIWGKGYFVSTVGLNEEIIRRYVEMQGKEETGQAELEL
ncbi:MAG: transposase [Candidatus Omnitrophica bacterium]|nr:transposase [Candidatus Omnitrophota bacterium]